ncbi:hypothetical protein [Deinococcus multiflagellatus]|uniref:Uncharacterized protein n=1 Tax=Deinococcus multiflagellatus TaxID=1656887 RepID=A0ABW1ZPQ5_9DEIO|nr:hypothetical protein [Deinococcus multiflagellatus]MBZ9715348.1 hypothetical protein [Deinococcus multiflagellatus]
MPDLLRWPAPIPGQPERLALALPGGEVIAHVATPKAAALFQAGWTARMELCRRDDQNRMRQWKRGWDRANEYERRWIAALAGVAAA